MNATQEIHPPSLDQDDEMTQQTSPDEQRLRHEILALASEVNLAMEELKSLGAEHIHQTDIPTATDELSAIVEMTESATSDILDAAERIERVGLLLSENTEAQTVCAAVTEIYQACNFQDITGQRVRKIVNTLRAIDHRITSICASFGLDAQIPNRASDVSIASGGDDGPLERGPSLPRNAMSQDDVDRMLANL